MKRTKLNYRFHNPNSAEDTADFLCKLLIEVNAGKVERAIEDAALYVESGDYILENLSEKKRKKYVLGKKSKVRALLQTVDKVLGFSPEDFAVCAPSGVRF